MNQIAVPKAKTQTLGVPLWDQLNDELGDGNQDSQRFDDCGEECCSMAIASIRGVPVAAGYLRYLIHGDNGTGLTNANDLARIFWECKMGSTERFTNDKGVKQDLVNCALSGQLVVVLGNYYLADPSVLHWVLAVDSDQLGVIVHNPWQGLRQRWAWSDFLARYCGQHVITSEKRTYNWG